MRSFAASVRQEIAALRDFNPVYVGLGSVASHPGVRDARGMSAMPPKATKLVRHNEPLRCANRDLAHCSKEYLYSITPSAHEHRADSSSILCIEPCVDNFLCLGNNRFFGTFLKRCRTFGQRR